jgi:hypothetical protein
VAAAVCACDGGSKRGAAVLKAAAGTAVIEFCKGSCGD